MGNTPASAAASSVASGAKNSLKGVGVGVESDEQKAARERKEAEASQAKLRDRELRDKTREADYQQKKQSHAARKAELQKKWAQNKQQNNSGSGRGY